MRKVPTAVEWVDALRATSLDPRAFRLLAPDGKARRQRWDRVVADRVSADPPPVNPADTVVGVGAHELSRALASALGRAHIGVAEAAALVALPATVAGGSMLVVADPSVLSHSLLSRLHDRAEAWSVRLGFLTGIDLAAMMFAAAKLVTRPSNVDDPRRLVLGGHGDGGHVRESADAPVCCGCVDAPVGLCDGAGTGGGHLLARELTADIMAMTSCNGIALDGARIVQGLSLVLALIDGGASAVVGVSGQVAVQPKSDQVESWAAAGGPADLATAMRADLTAPFGPPLVVLLGDPLWGRTAPDGPTATLTRDGAAAALRRRLAGPLGHALGEAAGALPAGDDVALVDLVMKGIGRAGDSLLETELVDVARRIPVGVCDTCGNDVEVLRGSAETELVICPLCGPAQVRLTDDACAVRPLGPWTDWRAGGVGQVLFAPLRAGVLPAPDR